MIQTYDSHHMDQVVRGCCVIVFTSYVYQDKGEIMKKKLLIGLVFGLIGIIGGIFIGLYQLETLSQEMLELIIAELGSENMLIVISAVQSFVYAFVSTVIGLVFMEKLGLSLHTGFTKKNLIGALVVGLFSGLLIVLSDRFIFASYLTDHISTYSISLVYLMAGILYGGIVEELLLRLFVMSGFALLISKFILRNKTHQTLQPWVYWTAIVISALLFGALHLPATALLFDLSVGIVIRALLLNGLPGIAFGYLYWKNGLSTAMLAHVFSHVIMQLVLMPIFF